MHGDKHASEREICQRVSLSTRWGGRVACLAALVALSGPVPAPAAAAHGLGFSWTPSSAEPYAACGRPTPGHSECLAIVVPGSRGLSALGALQPAPAKITPTAASTLQGTGVGGGFAPADLRSAYDLPSEADGSGQTVAIVDAYDDPDAEEDLERYRSHYDIPACTTANGCFKKVNQKGETTSLPQAEGGWAVEISLDLDMVSAACPNCHILLVEATTNENENLYTAEDEAAALGASEISNSWAGQEYSGETADDTYFDHPGVPIFASAGDEGYGVLYPAASHYVVAVGGTALERASNSRGWSETVWNETGSGCSKYEPKPAWQTASPDCERRTNNDIAAVASTKTPVSVADSYKLPAEFSQPEAGWTLVAGTSVSSPLMAGTMALANAYTKSFVGADAYYKEAVHNGTGVLDDVTSGSNVVRRGEKNCGNYLCNGEIGYDGPTGLGSPYGAPVVGQEPSVVTQAASSLTQTTATLNATVNPGGEKVTTCEFEYGRTPALGSSVPCATPPGSGESSVAVSASVSGLAPVTAYYFRVLASNAGGTGTGSIESFTTLPDAPAVVTGSASSVTQTTATLTGSVNPNGGEVGSCEVEYGTSATLVGAAKASCGSPGSGESPVAVSTSVSGLASATVYYFRVLASNAGGTGSGAIEPFTTESPATLAGPPEFGRCVAVGAGAGKYTNAGCTKQGGRDDYEWDPGVKGALFKTQLASSSVTLESAVKASKVTCTGEAGGGEYVGPSAVGDVILTLTGCARADEKCSSAGAAPGEIVTSALQGTLGVERLGVTNASNKIGLDLFPAGKAGPMMEFSCAGTAVVIQGSVIVPMKANKMLLNVELRTNAANGKQKPEAFAGMPADILEESLAQAPFEQVGLKLSATQTNEEQIEVNSVA